MSSQHHKSESDRNKSNDDMKEQDESNQSVNDNDDMSTRKWQWAPPLIEGVPPSPRGGHTATKTGGCIIIFGGHYYVGKDQGYAYLNDTYVLDLDNNKWHKPKISGTPPAPRYGHSAVLAGTRIIIFGGKGTKNTVYRDLHALDPVSMTWFQGPEGSGSPSSRFGHSANLVDGSKMVIFGGWNGEDFFNDVYVLDLEAMAWSQPKCSGPIPCPRQGHTSIQISNNLLIFGGFYYQDDLQKASGYKQGSQLKSCYLNDLRLLNTDNFVWARVRVSGAPPLPRFGHTSNISGIDLVVFGGWSIKSGLRQRTNMEDSPTSLDYFMVLNVKNLCWELGKYSGAPPLSRYGHTCTSIGSHMLIFGGWEYSRATNEVIVLRDVNAFKKNK